MILFLPMFFQDNTSNFNTIKEASNQTLLWRRNMLFDYTEYLIGFKRFREKIGKTARN